MPALVDCGLAVARDCSWYLLLYNIVILVMSQLMMTPGRNINTLIYYTISYTITHISRPPHPNTSFLINIQHVKSSRSQSCTHDHTPASHQPIAFQLLQSCCRDTSVHHLTYPWRHAPNGAARAPAPVAMGPMSVHNNIGDGATIKWQQKVSDIWRSYRLVRTKENFTMPTEKRRKVLQGVVEGKRNKTRMDPCEWHK